MNIELRPLHRNDYRAAAGVAARALRDNPINRAIFGDDPCRRLAGTEAAFRALLPVLQCPPLGAYQGDTLVGIIGVAPPGTCAPSLPRQLRMLPPLLRHGLGNLARVARPQRLGAARPARTALASRPRGGRAGAAGVGHRDTHDGAVLLLDG